MSLIAGCTTRTIRRGDIYWVDFGELNWQDFGYLIGRELCHPHPAIVISPDAHNANPSIPFVRVIPLTTARREPYGDELVIEPEDTGLNWASLVRVIQARAVDRTCLLYHRGRVSRETMREIEQLLLKANGIEIAQKEDETADESESDDDGLTEGLAG
jgi:mRNA-degrading endonuclease toxin of MazEF toxin-antitoxin module